MMNCGRMRFRVEIWKRDYEHETVDAYGRRSVPEILVAQVYAAVSDVSGKEFYEAAAHQLQHTVTFTMRWMEMSPSDYIKFRGEAYEVDEINHLGYRGDFLRVKAHAVQPEGVRPYAL